MDPEVERLRERLAADRRRLQALPAAGAGTPGPPDPETGESWDRLDTLGHMSEMVPFWTAQAEAILAGATEFGRDERGEAARRAGIDAGHAAGERDLRARLELGLDRLDSLLAGLSRVDLDRPARQVRRDGDRDADLRLLIERLLLGHLEAHLDQLESL